MIQAIIGAIQEQWPGISAGLAAAIAVVGFLLVIVSIIAAVVEIFLSIKYIRFNHKKASCGMCGKDLARKLLDENGLPKIKVSATGSLIFGNSYSHYFHKVRLRRLTYKKDSISSVAMAAQKTSLAVLDKEKDPDMVRRVKLIPLVNFGPLMFVPLVVIGVVLDIIMVNTNPICTYVCSGIGLVVYLWAFILSITELKTERKAQARAYKELEEKGLATNEELGMMKELFHLYNIEYVNNMVLALLELIYRVLILIANASSSSSSSSSSN